MRLIKNIFIWLSRVCYGWHWRREQRCERSAAQTAAMQPPQLQLHPPLQQNHLLGLITLIFSLTSLNVECNTPTCAQRAPTCTHVFRAGCQTHFGRKPLNLIASVTSQWTHCKITQSWWNEFCFYSIHYEQPKNLKKVCAILTRLTLTFKCVMHNWSHRQEQRCKTWSHSFVEVENTFFFNVWKAIWTDEWLPQQLLALLGICPWNLASFTLHKHRY